MYMTLIFSYSYPKMPTIYDVYGLVMPTCVGDGSGFQLFLLVITIFTPAVFIFLILQWVFTLDRHQFLFILGIVLNALFNWLLKIIIRSPRPDPPACLPSFGMPSGHVQFVFGILAHVVLDGFRQYTHMCPNPHRCRWHLLVPHPVWTAILVLIWGVLVAISRTVLGYHSVEQVIDGALVGVGFIMVYYFLVSGLIWQEYEWRQRYKQTHERSLDTKELIDSSPRVKSGRDFVWT